MLARARPRIAVAPTVVGQRSRSNCSSFNAHDFECHPRQQAVAAWLIAWRSTCWAQPCSMLPLPGGFGPRAGIRPSGAGGGRRRPCPPCARQHRIDSVDINTRHRSRRPSGNKAASVRPSRAKSCWLYQHFCRGAPTPSVRCNARLMERPGCILSRAVARAWSTRSM